MLRTGMIMKPSFRNRTLSKHHSPVDAFSSSCLLQTAISWSWHDIKLLRILAKKTKTLKSDWVSRADAFHDADINHYVINHHCQISWVYNLLEHTHENICEYYSRIHHQGRTPWMNRITFIKQYHPMNVVPRVNIKWTWETPDEYLHSSSPFS